MRRQASQVDWSKAKVTVARFNYDTTDVAMDSLADILFVALTQQLNLSTPPDVQSLSATMFLTGGDERKLDDPDFVLKSGCRFSLRGTIQPHGLNRDSIMIASTVYDCRLRKDVTPGLRPVYFPRKDMTAGVNAMLDVTKGYLFSRDTLPVSAPTYAAYSDYLKALQYWGRAPGEFATSKKHLLAAIAKDSSFFEAYTLLLDLLSNERDCKAMADTMNWLRERFPNPTEIQSSYIQYHLLDIDGERARAWQAFVPILDRKPTDLHLASDAVVMSLQYLNDPDKAISAMKRIADPKDVLQDCPYCETYMINGIRAYTEKGQPAKAAPWVEIVRPHANADSEFAILSSFYLANGQPEAVDQLIADLVRTNKEQVNRLDNLSYYHYSAFALANRLGAVGEAQRHLDLSLKYSRQMGHEGRIGRCMLLNGDARGATTAYLRFLDSTDSSQLKSPEAKRYRAELGIAYAQAGALKNANEIIRLLEADAPGPCDYGLQDYYVARILAHLGETDKSIAYLKQSLMKGMKFVIPAYFQYDPFLALLKDNKSYQDLLRSRQ
jgi:tetratricopeptide (TPR) repeat protein